MAQTDTLIHRLATWAAEQPDRPALHLKHGATWRRYTWSEYWTAVREVAKGLIALGHEVGDCVAIVGENRPEWVIAQFGVMAARGVPAPIYTNSTMEQTAFIVDHCRAKVAVADNAERLQKYRDGRAAGLMKADQFVLFDEPEGDADDVLSLAALRAKGRAQDDVELDARIAAVTAEETAILIYTSGTTGPPRACSCATATWWPSPATSCRGSGS